MSARRRLAHRSLYYCPACQRTRPYAYVRFGPVGIVECDICANRILIKVAPKSRRIFIAV